MDVVPVTSVYFVSGGFNTWKRVYSRFQKAHHDINEWGRDMTIKTLNFLWGYLGASV